MQEIPPLDLNPDFHEILVRLNSKATGSKTTFIRSRTLLHIHNKPVNFSQFGRELNHDPDTVSKWYYRGYDANRHWDERVKNVVKEPGHAGELLRKERLAEQILSDASRSGAPATYSAEQYTQIIFWPLFRHLTLLQEKSLLIILAIPGQKMIFQSI